MNVFKLRANVFSDFLLKFIFFQFFQSQTGLFCHLAYLPFVFKL